ncbi:MAG TPA: DUF2147 domain-containing protein [Phototrophicaceae bacterium]|jgi:uncharacterized protein (DUF2147 family)|nr:DUF2147 domain-containing protein [Phototrophicaceae bacterium]
MDVCMKLVGAATLALYAMSSAALAASPEGTWLSEDGGTKVRVVTCGGNKLCARLVWLHHPIDPSTGRPKTDKRNPDPAKRDRPLIGLEVVHALAPIGPNSWSGVIYNADDGHTYQASLKVESDVAKLKGCVIAVICKSHIWTRVDGTGLQNSASNEIQ